MNREILFRGKRADTKEWIYGDVQQNVDAVKIREQEQSIQRIAKSFVVIPETVGQFTGLTDIHGVKIFEGDIVNYNGSCHKVVFESRNGTGYFGIVVGENETWGFGNSTPAYMMAVVGNIYDNPELLKVTE